jgi:DNA-binding phage protein
MTAVQRRIWHRASISHRAQAISSPRGMDSIPTSGAIRRKTIYRAFRSLQTMDRLGHEKKNQILRKPI